MKKITIAYFGTPYFSAQFLEKLLNDTTINQLIEVKLVVTQPDAPFGRKHILTASPVKTVAEKYGIKVLESLRWLEQYSSSEVEKNLEKLDMAFLFAYGDLIPNDLLHVPKYGFWNTHPSLLPLYRGPGPMAYPLMMGDKKTGVTLIQLDEEIDHGPIIAQEVTEILPYERRSDLETRLTNIAYTLFKKEIMRLRDPEIKNRQQQVSISLDKSQLISQDHTKATFTRLLEKNDGFIPFFALKKAMNGQSISPDELPPILNEYWDKYVPYQRRPHNNGKYSSAIIIYNLFRGLYSWPGIWTTIEVKSQTKRLKLTDLTMNNEQLTINHVQLEGKKEVDFKTFQSAYHVF